VQPYIPGVDVQPTSKTLAIIQDKFVQKEHFVKAGVPLGGFAKVDDADELAAVAAEFGFPLMIKSRRMAYDGKGNAVAKTAADVEAAVAKLGGFGTGLYCEKWVPFARELAVIVIRSKSGETKAYPVTETEHVDNVCDITTTPAGLSLTIRARAPPFANLSRTPGGCQIGLLRPCRLSSIEPCYDLWVVTPTPGGVRLVYVDIILAVIN
jgi:phosphoribosylaminoimidazole carboxylase